MGALIDENAELPMMARTHGQPATPTTLGKELNVFKQRLNKEKKTLEEQEFFAKWGGATANYNPHLLAFPQADWLTHSEKFLDELELKLTKVSTQIEPHDYMAKVFHSLMRVNTILIDFSQDIWTYISFDFFKLKLDNFSPAITLEATFARGKFLAFETKGTVLLALGLTSITKILSCLIAY